ncbi:unnamed protein product [Boreogadus saida]
MFLQFFKRRTQSVSVNQRNTFQPVCCSIHKVFWPLSSNTVLPQISRDWLGRQPIIDWYIHAHLQLPTILREGKYWSD